MWSTYLLTFLLSDIMITHTVTLNACPGGCICDTVIECSLSDKSYLVIDEDLSTSLSCQGSRLPCDVLPRVPRLDGKVLPWLELKRCNLDVALVCLWSSLGVTFVDDIALVGISTLRDDVFRGATALRGVDLSHNGLVALPDHLFFPTTALERLNLSHNSLTALPDLLLSKSTKLENIDFSYNALTALADRLFYNQVVLESLDLSHNSITALFDHLFRDATSLKLLDLSYNNLNALADYLFREPTELETLNLSYNSLTALADVLFRETILLQNLDLNHNRLTALPHHLFRATTQLKRLDLKYNSVVALADQLFHSTTVLERLDISRNMLQHLSRETFRPLTSLTYLDLSHNNIEVLPDLVFADLHRVEEIILNDNRLHSVPNAFSELLTLRRVNLRYNRLKAFSIPMENLQELDMSGNLLEDIDANWRIRMPRLRMLKLRHNKFSTLKTSQLDFLQPRIEVDLRHNNVITVDFSPTYPPRSAKILLGNNPYNCDCRLVKFIEKVRDLESAGPEIDVEDATCADPKVLRSRSLKSLASRELVCSFQSNGEQYYALDTRKQSSDCIPSKTELQSGVTCSGQVIFEDQFDSLREEVWQLEQYIPLKNPEYPFISYQKLANDPTVFVKDSQLFIVPRLQQDLVGYNNDSIYSGVLDLRNSCTSTTSSACMKEASGADILPPVVTGRVTSKGFAFKYGTVHIRAKLPQGDWLYPELLLEPLLHKYGVDHFASGVIKIATARGNQDLKLGEIDYGNQVLYGGPILDFDCRESFLNFKTLTDKEWSEDFHLYSLKWTPESITLSVDGKEWLTVSPTISNLHNDIRNSCYNVPRYLLDRGSPMAPFDDYFYLTLGLAAGGVSEFPDSSTSQRRLKPWRNGGRKAMLHFWQHINEWGPTWRKSELVVDSVTVIAL